MDIIKVSANSRTSAVAGAIAGVVREHGRAEAQAIGAGAVNQTVKALVLAVGYLKERDDIDIVCVPKFVDVEIEDKVRTAIKFAIEPLQSEATAELDELDQLDQTVEPEEFDQPEQVAEPEEFDKPEQTAEPDELDQPEPTAEPDQFDSPAFA